MLNHLEKAFWTIGDKMLSNNDAFHSSLEQKTVTNELVIRPIANATTARASESKNSLAQLTKADICMLAAERYGIEFSMRDDKETLIAQFLFEQEQD